MKSKFFFFGFCFFFRFFVDEKLDQKTFCLFRSLALAQKTKIFKKSNSTLTEKKTLFAFFLFYFYFILVSTLTLHLGQDRSILYTRVSFLYFYFYFPLLARLFFSE